MKEKIKILAISAVTAVAISSMGLSPASASISETFQKEDLVPLKAEKVVDESVSLEKGKSSVTLDQASEKHPITMKSKKKEKVKPLQTRYDYSQVKKDEKEKNDKQDKDYVVLEDHMIFNTDGLTKDQVKWILTTAKLSKQKIPAAFFRAVAEQESDITPDVFAMDRNGGTWGIWQINEYHVGRFYDGGDFKTDRNDNGTPDVQEPIIAAKIAAAYFDDLYLELEQMRKDYPDEKWVDEMTVWETLAVAHNAGPTGMRNYPNFTVPEITGKYLENMKTKIPMYMND